MVRPLLLVAMHLFLISGCFFVSVFEHESVQHMV